jgi:hypothetical protein
MAVIAIGPATVVAKTGPTAFAAASIDFDTAPKVDYNPFTTGGPAVSAAH